MLHEAVMTKGKAFLFTTTAIEQNKVARDVLNLLLRTLLHAFPSTRTELTDARRFAFTPLVLGNLMQRVNRDVNVIVTRISNLDNLLHLVAVLHTDQASETTYTIVDVHNVVTNLKLLQLFER